MKASLRVCASCEWVYLGDPTTCPKCSFCSYGAHLVYGKKAYKYHKTQEPWRDKKLFDYRCSLNREITDNTLTVSEENYERNKLRGLSLRQPR